MKTRIYSLVIIIFLSFSSFPQSRSGGVLIPDDLKSIKKITDLNYNLELFPGQVFVGYGYFWSLGDSLTANFQASSESWVSMEPLSFTSSSCSDIVPVIFSFTAPDLPGTYQATFIDQNENWDQLVVTLTVTNNPSSAGIDSVSAIVGDTVTRSEAFTGSGFPSGCLSNYLPDVSSDIFLATSDNVNWLSFDPQNFTITINNPTREVTRIFYSDSAGEFSTYEMIIVEWYARPIYKKWIFKVKPEIEITSPSANELWISGEENRIKWNGGNSSQFLKIDYSTDNGNTFTNITSGIQADSGEYIWNIPENLLTTKAIIKITEITDTTITDRSDQFKIKGYVLTRIDANGDYEKFIPGVHGWQFSNTRNNIWPFSWWSQFDYSSNDPYTNKPYLTSWLEWPIEATFENFPDWPLFVKTFGVSQCYFSTSVPVYNPVAVMIWALNKRNWNGSCHGFAISSLSAFEFPLEFMIYFNFPQFTNLFNVQLDTLPRLVVNQNWTAQLWHTPENIAGLSRFQDPSTTLEEIKAMLLSDDPDKRALEIFENGVDDFGNGGFTVAGHSVVPYKVEKTPANVVNVYIYDNNYPADTTKRIKFFTLIDGWEYTEYGWDGDDNIFLSAPISTYLSIPNNSAVTKDKQLPAAALVESPLTIYNSSLANISIHNTIGDSIGYHSNIAFNTFDNAYPIIPLTSVPTQPVGYVLPQDNYLVKIDSSKEENTYTAFVTDSILMMFSRLGGDSTQIDKVSWQNGLVYETNDQTEKLVNFRTILVSQNSQKVFDLIDVNINQNDIFEISKLNEEELLTKNSGAEKLYDLILELASSTQNPKFYKTKINLPANTTHQISPDWNTLNKVTILQDIGSDGSIDDTITISNTVDVKDEGNLFSPDEYNLAQNYPNPFNPVTKIKYTIPHGFAASPFTKGGLQEVSLKVYDILGREVATLINEVQSPGTYEVEFNAEALSSGIYFYTLKATLIGRQAGNFILNKESFGQTKKMILLK